MYTKYFKLKGQPFQLSPDPRFLFESSVHKRAIAHLKFGLNQSEGFIVVTGDVGAGKTTIIQHLLSQLNRKQYIAATVVTTHLDQDNIIRMIASGFGISQEGRDKASLIREIEAFLIQSVRKRKRCLLFVDEAQNLSIGALEELRMLSNIQVDGQPPLQLFLLGQPQFRRTLAKDDLLQLRQRVIASYHLGPLDEQETRDYIFHRLHQVDWRNNPRFTEDALTKIHKFTEGVPRRINTFCSRLLLFCYLEESDTISGETVDAVADDLEAEFDQVLDPAPSEPDLSRAINADLLQDIPQEQWQEMIDLIESTPVEALAALQPANGTSNGHTTDATAPLGDALAKEPSYNQLFKRLLLLVLDEYLKGRPAPRGN